MRRRVKKIPHRAPKERSNCSLPREKNSTQTVRRNSDEPPLCKSPRLGRQIAQIPKSARLLGHSRTPQAPTKAFSTPKYRRRQENAHSPKGISRPCRIVWQPFAFHASCAGLATQTSTEFLRRHAPTVSLPSRPPLPNRWPAHQPQSELPSAASAADVAVKCAKQARGRNSPASAPAFARNCRSRTKNSPPEKARRNSGINPQFAREPPFGLERCSLDECVAICAGIPQLQAKVRLRITRACPNANAPVRNARATRTCRQ